MFAIRSSATTALSLLSILHLCNDIAEGKRQNKVARQKIKYPISIQGRGKVIHPANFSAHADAVEWVQHYASVDARKRLEPGVAGEMYKPFCSVDKAQVVLLYTNYE